MAKKQKKKKNILQKRLIIAGIIVLLVIFISGAYLYFSNIQDAQYSQNLSPIISTEPTISENSQDVKDVSVTSAVTKAPFIPVTSTPTPNPLPASNPVSNSRHGAITSVGCDVITGWAINPDNTVEDINVWVYIDGIFSGITKADKPSSSGLEGKHGFSIPMIAPAKDGQPRKISVQAEVYEHKHELNGSQQFFICPKE